MKKSNKIIVTGGHGFIGSYLINEAKKHNIQVICLKNINWRDFNRKNFNEEFNCLYHLAAKSFVPESFAEPGIFYENNFITTLNALEICRSLRINMVFISSYIYGNPKYFPIDEEHPTTAINPYAHSKIIGEDLCKRYFEFFGVNSTIIRPFNIYGPGQNKKYLIPKILDGMNKNELILNDPNPKRDYLYIRDFINLLLAIQLIKLKGINIFNAGSGVSYSVESVVDLVKSITGSKCKVTFMNKIRKNEIDETVADIDKSSSVLGWRPHYSLVDGIKEILQKYEA